jgi:DNA-binding PucR family transcriptional regulator
MPARRGGVNGFRLKAIVNKTIFIFIETWFNDRPATIYEHFQSSSGFKEGSRRLRRIFKNKNEKREGYHRTGIWLRQRID